MKATQAAMLAPWHARFLRNAVVYNLVVFGVFLALYLSIDFDTHWSSEKPVSRKGKLYFAVLTHTNCGSNDITPKTDLARMITAAHVTCAWMQVLLVFLR
jgi:hypothetical protein